eukprot:1433030-Karenia_brevis.AAC.1
MFAYMAQRGFQYNKRSNLSLPARWDTTQYWDDMLANIGYLFCSAAACIWVCSSPSKRPFPPRRVMHQVQICLPLHAAMALMSRATCREDDEGLFNASFEYEALRESDWNV